VNVLSDIGLWLWRLLPVNPILVRVVSNGGKRLPHFWARLIYLAALVVVFLFFGGLLREAGSLADLAKQSTQTFMGVSMVQLFLMSFIAPIFCAGAITQEKDANTYHILLTTPLSNAQIVLGSLFSRIYFVWVLLLAGLPIFCITMIYGGVTTREVFESFGLAACTGLVTGSIAIMISFLKVGTRRTIFSFFVGVAVYLLAVGFIGLSAFGQLAIAPIGVPLFGGTTQYQMSWLAPVHPFLALMVVTGQTPAPPMSDVYDYGWPARWLLAYPQYGYMVLTVLASALMVMISLFYVRRGAKEGENPILARIRELISRPDGERTRRPRRVWRNPIAWREAATRASAGGKSAMRWCFIVAGVAAGIVLLVAHCAGWWGLNPAQPDQTRAWLTALVWIELAVVLLVVTTTAATTLTREKESMTMEILLATPLTSRYIIAGMLQGLVRLVVPLIAVPTLTTLLLAAAPLFVRRGAPPVTTVEAVILIPVLMIAFAGLAAMSGLYWSLKCKTTVRAVMVSTAFVMGAAGLLWLCGFALGRAGPMFNAVALPFLPFPAVRALLDPWAAMGTPGWDYGAGGVGKFSSQEVITFRVGRVVASLISAGIYAMLTAVFYKNMVRGFDMEVRKQAT
jgi:ABC-type transport system involved in multi-copper enzyme maturation permease subunit